MCLFNLKLNWLKIFVFDCYSQVFVKFLMNYVQLDIHFYNFPYIYKYIYLYLQS